MPQQYRPQSGPVGESFNGDYAAFDFFAAAFFPGTFFSVVFLEDFSRSSWISSLMVFSIRSAVRVVEAPFALDFFLIGSSDFLESRARKRSTRPAVSTSFCFPVKRGWQLEQISTLISDWVDPVSQVFPHTQVTLALGW